MSRSITVYCASSEGLEPRFNAEASALGAGLAARGWTLIYGGGRTGMMGAAARAARSGGGRVVGIIPDFMVGRELANEEADELIITPDMRTRRRLLEERGDAFVALPGGFGTLEELAEILVGRMLNRHQKPLVLVNTDGFYDALFVFFDQLVAGGFKRGGWREFVVVAPNAEAVWPALEEDPARAPEAPVDPLWR